MPHPTHLDAPLGRCFFTIAMGPHAYFELACNLSRSYARHNDSTTIPLRIITDRIREIPSDIEFASVQVDASGLNREGLGSKLHLDQLAPGVESIFIDSDCLVFKDISGLFELFDGCSVSVVGFQVQSGDWSGPDTAVLCKLFNVRSIPRFNGGLYYVKKGDRAKTIYDAARALVDRYDELGFARHRLGVNEEPLISLAMALNEERLVLDSGTIMCDLAAGLDGSKINVIAGICELVNPPRSSPGHKWWYKEGRFYPSIIHFGGQAATHFPYTRETFMLRHFDRAGTFLRIFYQLAAFVFFTLPSNAKKYARILTRHINILSNNLFY